MQRTVDDAQADRAERDQQQLNLYLPYRGEFGHIVMWHAPWVNGGEDPKVVCLEEGMEALYPSAAAYVFVERRPDAARREYMQHDKNFTESFLDHNRKELTEKFGEFTLINHKFGRHSEDNSDKKYFVPKPFEEVIPKDLLDPIQVAICPRKRRYGEAKNWDKWPTLVMALETMGIKTAVIGSQETSYACDSATLTGWHHGLGKRSLDIALQVMHHATVVVATDSGLAHLAVQAGRPLLMVTDNKRTAPGYQNVVFKRYDMENHTHSSVRYIDGWTRLKHMYEVIYDTLCQTVR